MTLEQNLLKNLGVKCLNCKYHTWNGTLHLCTHNNINNIIQQPANSYCIDYKENKPHNAQSEVD